MKILVTTFFSIVLFILYVWYLEQSTIFIPDREVTTTPKQIGLDYDDVYFKAEGGVTLNGWLVKASSDPYSHATILFFHGNAGNIGDRLEKIFLFNKLGLNVFIIDYRGYGRSEGKSTEDSMYEDAIAAFDYLKNRKDTDHTRIICYGASLGGAAAIDLAMKRKVSSIIIDSSFSSAKDMAKVIFPFVPSFLVRTKMDSELKIKSVTAPKLFIHSRDDTTVPFALGKKLFDASPEPKEFVEISGGHNDGHLESEDEYWQGINNFLKNHNLI